MYCNNGSVSAKSRIIERPVEEHLRLRKEHIYIERDSADRSATTGDFETFKKGEIEITEHAEVPIVNKEARVVEEINIGKEVNEHVETVKDTVRKSDVEIEKISEEELRRRRTDPDHNPQRNA